MYIPEHDDPARLVSVGPVELEEQPLGDIFHILNDLLILRGILDADLALVEGERLRVHGPHHRRNGRLLALQGGQEGKYGTQLVPVRHDSDSVPNERKFCRQLVGSKFIFGMMIQKK